MEIEFYGPNNRSAEDIEFMEYIIMRSGAEYISVLINGCRFLDAKVLEDEEGRRYFKYAGKLYHFYIKEAPAWAKDRI